MTNETNQVTVDSHSKGDNHLKGAGQNNHGEDVMLQQLTWWLQVNANSDSFRLSDSLLPN